MKQVRMLLSVPILLLASAAWGQTQRTAATVPPLPGVLAAAQTVYVGPYNGDPSVRYITREDQVAVGAVQEALRKWGKLMVVPNANGADIVILVSSHPSEDVLDVYNGHQVPTGSYLWRVSARNGLQPGETPLVTEFETAFENIQKR